MLTLATCLLLGVAATIAVWRMPAMLDRSIRHRRAFADSCDHFYRTTWPLLNDERTPDSLLAILNSLSNDLDNARLVRRLLWEALTGKMRARAEDPPEAMLAFARDVNELPSDMRPRFVEAVGVGLVANALSAGLLGEIFLRLMIPEEAAATLAPEVAMLAAA